MGIKPWRSPVSRSDPCETARYLLRMDEINHLFLIRSVSQYLVFRFQRCIEQDFENEYKVSKLVFL